jgi:hypothetical protein
MRIKMPDRAFPFSPEGNETLRLVKDLGFPVRFNVVFERHGYTYATAKALIVDGEMNTLWERGDKRVGTLKQLYERLYRQFGRGVRLVPVPV